MSEQAASARVRGAAAVALAVAMLLAMDGVPYMRDAAAAAGHGVSTAEVFDENPVTDDLDPTDDGSIIVECVAWADPWRSYLTARPAAGPVAVGDVPALTATGASSANLVPQQQ